MSGSQTPVWEPSQLRNHVKVFFTGELGWFSGLAETIFKIQFRKHTRRAPNTSPARPLIHNSANFFQILTSVVDDS